MTIRDDILNFIIEETGKSIQEKRFDFENCNASFISQVIYQDRTNVSRILNQLFREELLIKKIGRPTIFISKDVLNREFPFSHFPNIIDKDVKLDKYTNFNENDTKTPFTQSFHIIGSNQEGSLYNGINQLMSLFFYPKNLLKTVILKGENGSGKKYILKEILNRCLKMGMIKTENEIIFVDINNFSINDFKKENTEVIVIQLLETTPFNKIKEIKQTFEIEYFNKNVKPILCFLYPNIEEKSELSKITPLYVEIPSFVARPAVEQIDLAISFLKKESERLQRKIKVSKSFIEAVIENSSNIDSLQQNIVYLVSRYFFDIQGKENEIKLNYELVSNCLPNINSSETNLDLHNIPEIFTIEPFEKEKAVDTVRINEKQPTLK